LENLISGNILTSTTNGKIEISSVTPGSISGTTTNGYIQVDNLNAQNTTTINFSATNGAVIATLVKFSGNFDAKTTNGNVDVNGQNVKLTTNVWNHKQGTVGTGDSTCTLKNTNGEITLNV
jgi:DUF4097 and DUF4098 domain-containing protein YvlB